MYGLHDRGMAEKIFDNQEVDRVGDAWTYSPLKYWADYTSFKTFDFFGYMPRVDSDSSNPEEPRNGAKLEKDPEAEE